MRRGTIFILVFILAAAGIIALTQLFRAQPALEIIVAVDPLVERWARDAATAFNAQGETVGVSRRVRVTVQTISDMTVFAAQNGWRQELHPDGWIPAWGVLFPSPVVGAGITARQLAPSVARTTLVWMSPDSAEGQVAEVSWLGVLEAVESGENIAFPSAATSVQGLATLISGLSDFNDVSVLTDAMLTANDGRNYLTPIINAVPNYATVGPDPALTLAGPLGATYIAGMATESQWLNQLTTLVAKNPRFAYPESPVIFDFPVYLLDSIAQTDDERAGVQAFAAFLASNEQQANAMDFGLRPASSEPTADQPLFARGSQYGILPQLLPTRAVELPQVNSVRSFVTWASNLQR